MKINLAGDQSSKLSKDKITERKFLKFPKRLVNKKVQKQRLNARMRRLVSPKSPLVVFFELYKNIPINVEEKLNESGMNFTASFVVDGQLYCGIHRNKIQAKQKACENFLRMMLAKKISGQSGCTDLETDDGMFTKFKRPLLEDFPWSKFASLAMHNLINHWKLHFCPKSFPKKTTVASGMQNIPQNPEKYHPVQLLYKMAPGISFTEKTISPHNPSLFEVSCELYEMSFKGQGSTKKAAKKQCSIWAIKHFWNFDFRSISENPS